MEQIYLSSHDHEINSDDEVDKSLIIGIGHGHHC